MEQLPLVSIIIPSYNYARYLPEALESALAQTYSRTEIIVVDDGSTDDTARVAAAYAPQVRYIYQDNQGLAATRNNGFLAAHGDYVVFLDADDKLAPTYLAETVAAAKAQPDAAFVYTQQQYFEASRQITTFPNYDANLLKEKNFIPACTLISADVLRTVHYDSRFTSWEDWDFYLSLAERGLHGVLVDKPLVLYRKHTDQQSMLDTFTQRQKVRTLAQLRYKHWRLYGLLETLRFTAWYWRHR